jgi:DNA-binding response OmpR family regulator
LAKILVIEDDQSFLELVRLHLSLAGYEVQAAEDPEEGLRSLIADPPDIILLDLDLPYLNGFEVLEALRSEPPYQKIPVIVVTGDRDDESYFRCQKMGIDGFFVKPVQSEQLVGAIARSLARRAGT